MMRIGTEEVRNDGLGSVDGGNALAGQNKFAEADKMLRAAFPW